MGARERFLWAASRLLSETSSRTNSDKSSLGTIISELRVRNYKFLEIHNDKFYLCPKCNTPWREGKFNMRIRSVKVPKKMKKWINTTPPDISSFKKKLLDSYRSKRDNVMLLRCLICQNITKCNLTKQKIEISRRATETETQSVSSTVKKKKKKDVLAGLKIHLNSKRINNKILDIDCKKSNDKDLGINTASYISKDNAFDIIGDKETRNKELPINRVSKILNISSSKSDDTVNDTKTCKNQKFSKVITELCSFRNEDDNCKMTPCSIGNDNVSSSSNKVLKEDNSVKGLQPNKAELKLFQKRKNKKKHKVPILKNTKQNNLKVLKDFINSLQA